jgi:predicted dithiol-disulfide oxidoreductase (DUF899 family)
MQHDIVSSEQWIEARKQLLAEEKAFTHARDRLNEKRRALPWVRLDKSYTFDGPAGPVTLPELFDGRSQLIIKHFMFGPDWSEGCVGCSFECDQVEGALQHLLHHDVSYAAVSRAPIDRIERYKARMGWRFPWVSSFHSDFNFDFHVSFTTDEIKSGNAYYNYEHRPVESDELSGRSVFYKDPSGTIFYTYSSFARGGEMFLGAYAYLDVTPNGRNETINGNLTDWVRRHDEYNAETQPTGTQQ